MLAVKKALAREGADAAIRLMGLRYTQRGHLSGPTVEHASADDLLGHAATVTAAARILDPAVVEVEKTKKWRKLRVHRVSLDRYLGDSGLDLAKEEIELMTGESLPYAPRWIRCETLEDRFHNGTAARWTFVIPRVFGIRSWQIMSCKLVYEDDVADVKTSLSGCLGNVNGRLVKISWVEVLVGSFGRSGVSREHVVMQDTVMAGKFGGCMTHGNHNLPNTRVLKAER